MMVRVRTRVRLGKSGHSEVSELILFLTSPGGMATSLHDKLGSPHTIERIDCLLTLSASTAGQQREEYLSMEYFNHLVHQHSLQKHSLDRIKI
jgi:hypothetical protein